MKLRSMFLAYSCIAKLKYNNLCNTFACSLMNTDDKQSFHEAMKLHKEYGDRFTGMFAVLQPEIVPLANVLEGRDDIQSFYDFAKAVSGHFDDAWRSEYGEGVDGSRAINTYLYPNINYLSRTTKKFVDTYDASGGAVKDRLDSNFDQSGKGEVSRLVYFRDNINNVELKEILNGIKKGFEGLGVGRN
jgi:hypothetical protein